jgi:hypothetical protein
MIATAEIQYDWASSILDVRNVSFRIPRLQASIQLSTVPSRYVHVIATRGTVIIHELTTLINAPMYSEDWYGNKIAHVQVVVVRL